MIMSMFSLIIVSGHDYRGTYMEMFGCSNLVSCKVAKRLKVPWICNQRIYGFCTPEVGDTHIWVLQFVNPIVKALIKIDLLSRRA